MYKIAIVGYGNIGKYACEAVKAAPDMELVGVVRRPDSLGKPVPMELKDIPIVGHISDLKEVDVALLCAPTRSVEAYGKEILELGINTVDSFDIHDKIVDLRNSFQKSGEKGNSVAVIAAGWDPGSEDAGSLGRQLAAYTTTGQFIKGLHYLLQGISSHAETTR